MVSSVPSLHLFCWRGSLCFTIYTWMQVDISWLTQLVCWANASKQNDATAEKLHMMCVCVCRFKCRQSLLAVFFILKRIFTYHFVLLREISSYALGWWFFFSSKTNERYIQWIKLNAPRCAMLRAQFSVLIFSLSFASNLTASNPKIDRITIFEDEFRSLAFFVAFNMLDRERQREEENEITPICRLVSPDKWSINFSRMCVHSCSIFIWNTCNHLWTTSHTFYPTQKIYNSFR